MGFAIPRMSPTSPFCRVLDGGFTLIEVMMAATILVVGFIGLVQAVTIGSEMLDTSRKQTIAGEILDGEVERLRVEPWSTILTLNSAASGTITINSAGTGVSGNATRFAITNYSSSSSDDNTALIALAKGYTCSYFATQLRTNFYRFTYTVSWTGNTGRQFSRTATAYLGKNGLNLSYQKS